MTTQQKLTIAAINIQYKGITNEWQAITEQIINIKELQELAKKEAKRFTKEELKIIAAKSNWMIQPQYKERWQKTYELIKLMQK